ncbi:hypothetical protein [Nostoc sp. NMS9]|nr:hypothetical protein [Nostoc sp. NMS9]
MLSALALLRLLNIPNLMLAYLNELNCDRPETEPDNPTSKEMPKL